MPAKKKILILDNSLYPTGALRSILNAIAHLEGEYTFCFAIHPDSRTGPLLEERGYRVFRIPFKEVSRRPAALIGYLPSLYGNARRLLGLVKREGIDILHVNDLFNQLGTAVKVLKPSVPVVYHVRLLASSYIGKLFPLFASLIKRKADRLICVSGAVLEDVGPTPKAQIIYDGMQATESLPSWNGLQDPARARILYLGNIVRGKGQQWGVQALATVAKTFPKATLTFAGGVHSPADEQFKEELIALAAQLGIGGQIQFTGAVSHVEELMKGSDIVLNMSESESFSMVCLEAMLYGVPLVASDCGGPRDITENGTKATLVPNRDAAAAASAVVQILKQPEGAKALAAAGKSYAAEKYALSRSVAQLRAVYENLFP